MASRGVQLAGRYALIEPIGTGRLAVVWRAWDSRLERAVAVKVIRPHYSADGALRRRILAAARRASKLDHPNIVRVDEAAVSGELLFLVTELVDGPTLAEVVGRTRLLPPIFALELGASVASSLALAHRRRVVHGDISATDIFLGRDGWVRVADFGLATAAGLTPPVAGRATAADDVAALGALVFRLVRGRAPADAPHGVAPDDDVDAAESPSLGHYLPAAVDELLTRATSHQPGIAFATAAELGDELAAAAAGLRAGLEQPEADHETQVALAAARPALLATHPAVRDPPEVAPAKPVRRRRTSAAVAPPPPAVPAWEPVTVPRNEDPELVGSGGGFAEPLRRDRGRRALAGAALAVLLVAVGAAPSLTRAPRGGVLGATASPPAVAARPTARSSVIFPTPLRTPVATPSPAPTATPTPAPTPPPTPPPTPRPAPATPRPTAAPPRLSPPSAAVANFYDAVAEHDWDRAIAAWSPGMRQRYPVDGYLIGRFRPTTDIDITALRLITIDEAAGTATVAVSLVEYRSVEPSPRTFDGDWDLILVDGRWLLHDPDF